MLEKLPTELLLRTLQLAAPLDYSSSIYLERRNLLLNCCLVSKRVCGVAQPMLPQVFLATTDRDVALIAGDNAGTPKGSKVKLLVVSVWISDTTSLDLRYLLSLLPNLVDVRLMPFETVDLQWFSGNTCTVSQSLLASTVTHADYMCSA